MTVGWEIERKFLVDASRLPSLPPGEAMVQAYLGFEPVVRVRVARGRAYLTIKGPGLLSRREVEVEIPLDAARELLELRSAGTVVVEKVRHEVFWAGRTWEVDVFLGALAGLVLAEVELGGESEHPDPPPWAGPGVTGDPRYQNANLARAGSPPAAGEGES